MMNGQKFVRELFGARVTFIRAARKLEAPLDSVEVKFDEQSGCFSVHGDVRGASVVIVRFPLSGKPWSQRLQKHIEKLFTKRELLQRRQTPNRAARLAKA